MKKVNKSKLIKTYAVTKFVVARSAAEAIRVENKFKVDMVMLDSTQAIPNVDLLVPERAVATPRVSAIGFMDTPNV